MSYSPRLRSLTFLYRHSFLSPVTTRRYGGNTGDTGLCTQVPGRVTGRARSVDGYRDHPPPSDLRKTVKDPLTRPVRRLSSEDPFRV